MRPSYAKALGLSQCSGSDLVTIQLSMPMDTPSLRETVIRLQCVVRCALELTMWR